MVPARSASAHTPGPWHLDYPRIKSAPDCSVACIFALIDGDENEQAANAHLIAAAPELLKSCKAALKILGEILCDLEEDRGEGDCVNQLDCAIAKAEGRG